MPIYVQWKWQEQTKTFLVVFHFLDDFSATNLRAKIEEFDRSKDFLSEPYKREMKPYLTWAPSHPELGLLSEILSYANVINGLSYNRKRKLRDWLEGRAVQIDWKAKRITSPPKGKWLIEYTENGQISTCFVELSVECINWLKKLLKPYLKD